ncbi:response regulator [Rhodospirillaceae bacterium AH-315-P19]|nr:response regulator [Rhodospirillaceae bacterium AH-315-P19]
MAHILLAEDDQSMREFLARSLRRAGHIVEDVGDGDAVLRLIKDEADFDLLLADIVMPGVDGIELVQRVSGKYPKIKIMLITGFAAVSVRAKETLGTKTKVLSKPFHLKDLIQEVETVLAA